MIDIIAGIQTAVAWLAEDDNRLYTGLAAAVVSMALTGWVLYRLIAGVRGRDMSAKASLGFAAVQVGLAYITITGVYEFWRMPLLDMPPAEAAILALIIESVQWACVGAIYLHGRDAGTVGFGPAGPWFWTAVVGGGLLAVLASGSLAVALGRIVVVVLGAGMWYLQLRRKTRRSSAPSRWVHTPRTVLISWGWLRVGEEDLAEDPREWQVRQLARAHRWANRRWPLGWLGRRTLTRRAETVKGEVLAEARKRYATAHVVTADADVRGEVMQAILAAARRELSPTADVPAPRPVSAAVWTSTIQGQTRRLLAMLPPPVKPSPAEEAPRVEEAAGAVVAARLANPDRAPIPTPPAWTPPVVPVRGKLPPWVETILPREKPQDPPVMPRKKVTAKPATAKTAAAALYQDDPAVAWIVSQLRAGKPEPTIREIREKYAVDGKPRSENWALPRRKAARERVGKGPRAVA